MRTIYKYAIPIADEIYINMPKGSRIVHFGKQAGSLTVAQIWADVVPENPPETRRLAIHGTGHPIGTLSRYIGTCFDGPYVWHLYDRDGLA